MDGRTDESLFIIYTNTDVSRDLKSDKVTDIGEAEFLMTGGSVLQFNEEEHKAIYEHLQELPKHREFLSRFRIFYRQADEKEMDWHIKSELQQSMKLADNELDLAYMCYIEFIKDWWQNCNYFLKETNSKENDPLRKTSEKVRTTLVANILDQRKSELDELSIKYKQSTITDMEQMIESHKAVLIFAPGRSTTLTAAKIHQMLSATKYKILNLQQLNLYKNEVMLAWMRTFNVLVVESDSSEKVSPHIFNVLSDFLNNSIFEKKFIFISNRVGNIQQIYELRRTFYPKLRVEYDDFKFTDIVTDSRMLFLDKEVYFQGFEVKLSTIVKNDDVRMLNALDCDSISLLLENGKPSIGIPIKDTLEYYIERTLQNNRHVKTSFSIRIEVQFALSGDILQETRDISPHMEKNLGRETTTDWKPSTLIAGEGRIILVTDDPGMGKSTLLSHLAKETRERHPEIWIVRVNINNYTRVLLELKANGCDENGVIKLLTEAAKIKETDGIQLEGRLFNYTYSSTGNMAVLIDGVDEVSPHYTEEVIQVLKILSKTKIERIWVTSRNSVKGRLESEFQCQSYSLVPFSEEDQKNFLVKYWKETCPDILEDHLENLANRVVKLSTEHRSLQDKEFMGIPLQSLLLAEMFEEYLKQYSTAATVELPEYINVVMLYDRYVGKKWDIYLSDKRASDRTNVSVQTDDVELHKTFIHNHTAAALVVILSTQQLEKLADKTMTERAREFLQKITETKEKTGIIIDVIEGQPVFQHRTLAEYFAASWLCDDFQNGQEFMRDHLFESEFDVVRSMVDRILADKCPVHEAVINSNVRLVTNLLRRKESVSEKDHGERTPLHIAVSCSNTDIIRLLLEQGADGSSVDAFLGLSPVDYASRMNNWEVLTLMMDKRSDIREQVLNGPNQYSLDGITYALRAAAKYGRNDLLEYLIRKGNSVNMALPGNNSTLLHEAVKSQQTETIKILVQLGARTVSQDPFGRTPLHVAVENRSLEVIKCLVECQETVQKESELKNVSNPERTVTEGNFLNVPDVDGNTPLHLGVASGNTNIVFYLISAGSDKNTCNIRGEYPLTLAARCGKNDIVELLMVGEVQCEAAQIDALRAAIVAGLLDTMDLLLRLGAPVNKGQNEKPIHVASELGRKEIVSLLLQYGASLTSRTDSGNTALHLASEHEHLSLVKYLVEEERDDLNTLNHENETPLHLAARNGRDYIVTYFAEKGCNINAPSANGSTCLHVACENGHYTTVECLLKHGAEVNAMNSAEQTPLHIAASRGKTKIVQLLLQHNANLKLRDKDGITALLAASINGYQDTEWFILQYGGNIEDTDRKGNSIAHFAVANENYDILNFLSQQNVSLDVQNSDGDTPLLQAVREGKNRLVRYLVERNWDINTQNNDGMRPLDVAVQKGNKEISRLLLERNARSCKAGIHMVEAARFAFLDLLQHFEAMGDDINVRADNGESPLHSACESGQVATVQYLCEHGALLDLQDNNGNTALHVAVCNGHLEVTRVLVEKGANLCATDISGSTALHKAAKGGYLNIVQYLADSLAPIDKRNAKNETALLVAATDGHEKIVSFFIEEGAGIGVRNVEGNTALDISRVKGYTAIKQLLIDRAEGRKLVCSISHIDLTADSVGDTFEHLHRTADARESAVTDTDRSGNKTEELLKTRGDNTMQFQSNPRSALHIAAANCKLEEVQRLVEDGVALDCGDPCGRTALWGAAKRGHKSIIRFLLQNGSCGNLPDSEGVTPIDIAAIEGHWDTVDEFLKHDTIIGPEGTEYLTNQLYEASESDEIEVVRKILNCGISVDTNNKFGYTPLHVAVMSGHIGVTRILLESGARVNAIDCDGKTPIILAAERGYVEMVRELLNNCASVNTSNEEVITPLSSALANGHVVVFKELLNYGAEVDIRDEFGDTPLYTAAREGQVEIVRELLNHGASVDFANQEGTSPLQIAAREGHVEIVRELLNHDAAVNLVNKKGTSTLQIAAQKGHVEIVRELLNHDAAVNLADEGGQTPLQLATIQGHAEVVRELLKHGANANLADKKGATPLLLTVQESNVEVLREFLNHGVSMDLEDEEGRTPLQLAALKGHLDIVRELLRHGTSADLATVEGYTPLQLAAVGGYVEIVRELLNHGASVDLTNIMGFTPLQLAAVGADEEQYSELLTDSFSAYLANEDHTPLGIAAKTTHVEVVRELLTHGASVDLANVVGYTPLGFAARAGQAEVVRELLNHGARKDLADKKGKTPLFLAVKQGHVEVVRELLKHGASVNLATKKGKTPLQIASNEYHIEIVLELLKHGANVDLADKESYTPLLSAAEIGHEEFVRELLSHSVSAALTSEEGHTPLQLAAIRGYVDVVRELLSRGADVGLADKEGYTPLLLAAEIGHVEFVRELLSHGVSADLTTEGYTPLQLAAIGGHVEIVRDLLSHGASADLAGKGCYSPLQLAAEIGDVEIIRELLKHGANVDLADKEGYTPLHLVAQNGNLEVVRELLKYGASLNLVDKEGYTPLQIAGSKDHIEIVLEMLNHGANVDLADED